MSQHYLIMAVNRLQLAAPGASGVRPVDGPLDPNTSNEGCYPNAVERRC